MYSLGNGVGVDYKQAFYWYEKAAQAGLIEVQYYVGALYLDDKGVNVDYRQALIWCTKAANPGHSYAQILLAVI